MDPRQAGNRNLNDAYQKTRKRKQAKTLSNQQKSTIIAFACVCLLIVVVSTFILAYLAGNSEERERAVATQQKSKPAQAAAGPPKPPQSLGNEVRDTLSPNAATDSQTQGQPADGLGASKAPDSVKPNPGQSISPTDSIVGTTTQPEPRKERRNAAANGNSKRAPDIILSDTKSDSSSTSKRRTPAPTGSDANPFSLLPAEIDLQFTTSLEEESETIIGLLQADANASWEVKINSEAADLEGLRFDAETQRISDGITRWPIQLKLIENEKEERNSELLSASVDEGEPIAYVVVADRELSLTVASSTGRRRLPQLRNCILTLSNGKARHEIQLRKCLESPGVAVTLDEPTITTDFPFDAMPKPHVVALRLRFPTGVPDEFTVTPINETVKVNEELTLASRSMGVVSVKMRFNSAEDKFKVRVMPRYELSDRQHPLVPPMIAKDIRRLTRNYRQNERDLAAAKSRLAELPHEFSRVKGMPARTPSQVTKRASLLSGLQSEHKKRQSCIRRISKSNPRLKKNIRRLRQISAFAKDFRGNLEVQYELVAETSDGEIKFARTK